jgi:hypothetical protein
MIDWYNEARKSNLTIKNQKQFITNFGVLPWICDYLFSILLLCKDIKFETNHLLMTLYFLKCYPFDDQASAIWHLTRKTWSKWVWGTLAILYLHFTGEGSLVNYILIPNFIIEYIFKDKLGGKKN